MAEIVHHGFIKYLLAIVLFASKISNLNNDDIGLYYYADILTGNVVLSLEKNSNSSKIMELIVNYLVSIISLFFSRRMYI